PPPPERPWPTDRRSPMDKHSSMDTRSSTDRLPSRTDRVWSPDRGSSRDKLLTCLDKVLTSPGTALWCLWYRGTHRQSRDTHSPWTGRFPDSQSLRRLGTSASGKSALGTPASSDKPDSGSPAFDTQSRVRIPDKRHRAGRTCERTSSRWNH